MKKLLALAMLLVLCAVLTGLLTGCKVSAANTMMTDGVPKVAVTSPDVPVISTKWTERQYTVSEQDETVLLTARYQIPVLTLTGSPDNSDTAAKNRQAAVQRINDWFTGWRDQQVDMLDETEQMAREEYETTGGERWKTEDFAYRDEAGISWWQNERLLCVTLSYVSYTGGAHPSTWAAGRLLRSLHRQDRVCHGSGHRHQPTGGGRVPADPPSDSGQRRHLLFQRLRQNGAGLDRTQRVL